jgi:hypothetical protein
MNKMLFGFAGIAGSILCLSAAQANTVNLTLSETGFASNTTTGNGNAAFSGTYGTFTINNTSGTGLPFTSLTDILNSQTSNVSSSTGGTLTVTVTELGLTGTTPLVSAFTSNSLFNATLTEETFYDLTDAGLLTNVLGGPVSFTSATSPGTDVIGHAALSGTYSLSEVYTITAAAGGSDNSTIDIAATPIPGSLPLFASGLLGFWGWKRKRNNQATQSCEAATA